MTQGDSVLCIYQDKVILRTIDMQVVTGFVLVGGRSCNYTARELRLGPDQVLLSLA
jgi:hypothetical protein